MKKLLTVIGARPQFIKAAAISRTLNDAFKGRIEEKILHTGQHYDNAMSNVFFDEMNIPRPHFTLQSGGGSHGAQTAAMLEGIEEVLLGEKFDGLLVYGDTNSTLAGALAAAKLYIPVIHVEAGLRSFNKAMPEELNRIMCDHASTLLFCPTDTAVHNLRQEGFDVTNDHKPTADHPAVHKCGDIMFDNTLYFSNISRDKFHSQPPFTITRKFVLATIHRPYNTDDGARLLAILSDLEWLTTQGFDVVFPIHPRTLKAAELANAQRLTELKANVHFHLVPPASFLEMIYLEQGSELIVTDSGGVQKEAYFLRKPSVVVRTETEWTELIDHGSAILCFETGEAMRSAFLSQLNKQFSDFPPIFGDGHAATFICQKIVEAL
ncbi:MAG: hypothetical protein RL226_1512 [Bacteroidota bacterium]